jgi:hypothetical protein
MKIKLNCAIAGHADTVHGLDKEFAFRPGEIVDLPEALAQKWIKAEIATALEPPKAAKKGA